MIKKAMLLLGLMLLSAGLLLAGNGDDTKKSTAKSSAKATKSDGPQKSAASSVPADGPAKTEQAASPEKDADAKDAKPDQSSAQKKLWQEYLEARKGAIDRLTKAMDEEYTRLNTDIVLKRRQLKKKIVSSHPELATMKAGEEKNKAFRQYTKDLVKAKDPDGQAFQKAYAALNAYLLEKDPKMKELFTKLHPEDKKKAEEELD